MARSESRRLEAARLLETLNDDDLRDLIAAQQHASWRRPDVIRHHHVHGEEWADLLGESSPTLEEYAAIGPRIAVSWDRLFLAIEEGGPTWLFVAVSRLDHDVGVVAAMRRGRIRTTLVAGRLALWVQRQVDDHGAIEVTERARSTRE